MNLCFEEHREGILQGIASPEWDLNSGVDAALLGEECRRMDRMLQGRRSMDVKARMLAYLLDHAQLSDNAHDLFTDRLNHGDILRTIRLDWQQAAETGTIQKAHDETLPGCKAGAWNGIPDYSHTAPDWDRLLGLIEAWRRREFAMQRLCERNHDFGT